MADAMIKAGLGKYLMDYYERLERLLIALIMSYIILRGSNPREPLPPPGPALIYYLDGTLYFVLAIICLTTAFLLHSLWYYVPLGILTAACVYRCRQYKGRARTLNQAYFISRPKVLYLRSFSRDPSLFRQALLSTIWYVNPCSATLEEQLASAVKPLGTLIAIGNPNEALPTPGGLRLYERHQDWQQAVGELMQDAQAVIIQASSTPGLIWEMNQCRNRVQPERLVILLHKLSKKDFENVARKYNQVIPGYHKKRKREGLIFFGPDWTASFHQLKAPFWRCPYTRKLQAQLTHSLKSLFGACHIMWKPHPFALLKLLLLLSVCIPLIWTLAFLMR